MRKNVFPYRTKFKTSDYLWLNFNLEGYTNKRKQTSAINQNEADQDIFVLAELANNFKQVTFLTKPIFLNPLKNCGLDFPKMVRKWQIYVFRCGLISHSMALFYKLIL